MSRHAIWKISVATTREGEEAVSEIMGTLFRIRPAAYANTSTGKTLVSVYGDTIRPPAPDWRRSLHCELERIKQCGLKIGTAVISISRLKREDWAESWKRHFKPMEIGGALLIRPSWSKHKPRAGQSVMVLDPGLSFGSGHHATTSFCLRQLVRNRKPGAAQSFLDIGTGSGILAIAAAKLGYRPAHAFDFDPDAVKIARRNALVNKVLPRLRISHQDLTQLQIRDHPTYDLICANLISNLLVAERSRIARLLEKDGLLVIAGILKSEFPIVERAYNLLGFRVIKGRSEREWRSAVLCRHSP